MPRKGRGSKHPKYRCCYQLPSVQCPFKVVWTAPGENFTHKDTNHPGMHVMCEKHGFASTLVKTAYAP